MKDYGTGLNQVVQQLLHLGANVEKLKVSSIQGLDHRGITVCADFDVYRVGHPDQCAQITVVFPKPEHGHAQTLQDFSQFLCFHVAPSLLKQRAHV